MANAGPKQRSRARTMRLVWFMVAFLPIGCSSAGDIQRRISQESRKVFLAELSRSFIDESNSHEAMGGELTLAKVFALCLLQDPQIKSLRLKNQINQISVDQAKSLLWPRLWADALAQFPIGGRAWEPSSDISAGIFLRYDLIQAIFSSDLAAVEGARQQRTAENIALEEKKVFYRLLRLLNRSEYYRQAEAVLSEHLDSIETARARMDEMGRRDADMRKQLDLLDVERGNLDRELLEFRMQRIGSTRSLQKLIGLPSRSPVDVSDFLEPFPDPGQFDEAAFTSRNGFALAWRQRNDIRMLELDYFIAEMGILAADRGGLPRIGASLGVGHILTYNQDDSSVLVPSFNISFPLFDMGDVKRQVHRAKVERDLAHLQLVATARNLSETLQEKALQTTLSAKRSSIERMHFEKASRRSEDLQALLAIRRAGLLEICLTQVERIKAQLRWLKAGSEYREAYIDILEILGASLQDLPKAEAE